jgi:transposase
MGANLGRDHTVWQPEPDEISNRLGWLRSPEEMPGAMPEIEALVEAVRARNRRILDLDARTREEVEASGTTLTDIFGVGPILAAKIIALVGDTRRFPTNGHCASYAGVAPVEVSSGEVVRHCLSLAGNRRLNHALHMIAINQVRYEGKGGVFYRKKIAEGKTHREAMRCLKRRVSDAVFKKLTAGLEKVRTAV